jgi:NPCBM/NEW2 domain
MQIATRALAIIGAAFLAAGVTDSAAADQAAALPAGPTSIPARFEATWEDGTVREAAEIESWTEEGEKASLGGRRLFAPGAMVRTLRNPAIPAKIAEGPFIEFLQGDILPAQVIGKVDGNASPNEPLLLVRPRQQVDLAGAEPRDVLRIRPDWIRRIVWTPTPRHDYQPGTAFRSDRGRVSFQRFRLQPDGVHLLAEESITILAWNDLDELHLPAGDWWQAHAREVAVLSPDLTAPLVRLVTGAGMRLTTALSRLRIWTRSGEPRLKDAFHFLQPAWSADILCVGRDQVRHYSVLPPLVVPLSAVEPIGSAEHPIFSRLLPHWLRDANIAGETLASGGREFGWGLGTFGGHDLEFPLHPAVQRLQTGLGLDRAAGSGGCLRGRVEVIASPNAATAARLLHETPILTGASQPLSPFSVAFDPDPGLRRVRMIADPVSDGGPADADPFDIRDFCDWLEPRLELRREPWLAAVTAAIPQSFPELAGWKLDGTIGRDWRTVTVWDPTTRPYPSFNRVWILPGFSVTLSRTITVPKAGAAKWIISARRTSAATGACRLDVAVDGRPIAKLPLAEPTAEGRSQPLTVDLDGFAGRELRIEVRLVPLAGETRLIWDGAAFEFSKQ